MLIGALLTPCNIYSGLKIGWSFNISIIALLLSAGFWTLLARVRICGRLNAGEANIAQTAASSPFHIISGYRSPKTNAMLRKTSSGVAKFSYHMLGRAVDIRLPDCDTRTLRQTCIDMQRGGVGYYPRSDFVHVDTGAFRTWNG